MDVARLPRELVERLNDLFTRCYFSAATYVFEASPFEVSDDAPVLERLAAIKAKDRDHALLLAGLLRSADLVPEPGVFPYWHRDLNYLSVPFLAGFVADSLRTDLQRIDAALASAPADLGTVRAMLQTLRREREALWEDLAPCAEDARHREAERYAAGSRAIRESREAREAAARAKAAAAKKAAAEAKAKAKAASTASAAAQGDLPDPDEPGISSKERARRTMMRKRAEKAAASAPPAAAPAPAGSADLPDPDEPGISSKEKARRTMMIKRARKKASESAAAPAPAASDELPDPDEPGISAKEKARRQVLRMRARKAKEKE